MKAIKQEIKYDSERDPKFVGEVMDMSRCATLNQCIQCGACSGICPLSIYMDLTPRRVMNLVRSGFKTEVLSSNTIWLCSSCYACAVDCPKQINITDVMYSLKRRAIQEGLYPKGFAIPVLAREFFKMVRTRGRTTESRLVVSLYLKTNWTRFFSAWRLGLNLATRGRFSMRSERIKGRKELARILDAVDTNGKEAPAR
jgi:heterodisulfide reductase subunit C